MAQNEREVNNWSSDSEGVEKKIIFASLFLLLFPAFILILSGDFLWIEGWIFSVWFIFLCYTTIFYLYRRDPALLEERFRQPGSSNEEDWDRYVVYGIAIIFTIWIIIMPLDAKRFGWSPTFPIWLELIGIAMLVGSFFLFFRSYTDNTYLSPLVRIQDDRGQEVISTGVYGFVRHPMYLGATLMLIGTPLLLGSLYGLLLGFAGMILLMIRILGEEEMLTRRLDGYRDYKQKVRYRLIPFVW